MKIETIEVVKLDTLIDFILEHGDSIEAALRYKDTTMLEDIIVDIPTLKCKIKNV